MRLIPTLKRLALLCGASLALLPLGVVVHAQDATPAPVATPAPAEATVTGDPTGIANPDFITKYDGTLKNDKGEVINAKAPDLNNGDIAWMLIASALVLFMTPGLALFYAGMARVKNVLNVLMQSFIAMSIVTVVWIVVGYSLAFSPGSGATAGIIGGMDFAMLKGVGQTTFAWNGTPMTIPHQVFMCFQMMFAVITPALISGAIVERMKFSAYCVFIALWSLLVYSPMAHMVWGAGGLLFKKGALDFAGGTVIHMTSGFSALVLAILLGKRRLSSHEDTRPHNLPMTLIGTGILWFGWFGFNAGSAGAANGLAGSAFTVTHIAAAVAGLVWCLIEWVHVKQPTALGFASGAVAGLVAITPASGFVSATSAIIIGAVVPFISYGAIQLKNKLQKYDDTLDVFAVHGLGGTWGAIATGIFADEKVNSVVTASIKPEDGGRGHLMLAQFSSIGLAILFGVVGTLVISLILKVLFKGIVVSGNEEEAGLDLTQHGETGYVHANGGAESAATH
ncbi:ammonium transporter [Armatimonas sp.]|uniref:ammonium transporter n=1 Tax=Armatimonas sp. TaxID=1872638 RepID=UPI0037500EF4